MIELPQCRHREVKADKVRCLSLCMDGPLDGRPWIDPRYCAQCGEGVRDKDCTPPPPPPPTTIYDIALALDKPVPRPRCPHEGQVIEYCGTCGPDRAELRHVRDCEVHDRCVRDRRAGVFVAGLASCHDCADHPLHQKTLAFADRLLSAPPPPGAVLGAVMEAFGDVEGFKVWQERGPVRQAYRLAAQRVADESPPYPEGEYRGRGVVIAAGGAYWPGAYLAVRMLRHLGCSLPVEVWYIGRDGERDDRFIGLLARYGAVCRDADEERRRHPYRILNGFEVKLFAAAHSSFEEVLYLDADCYPVQDPATLFDDPDYLATGAIFWPDQPSFNAWTRWHFWGVEKFGPDAGFETGQYLINKRKSWRALRAALWFNEHSDWCYASSPVGPGGDYGDKGPVRVAWAMLRQRVTMHRLVPDWIGREDSGAFVQHGPRGPAFVHRCRAKFKLEVPFRPGATPQPAVTNGHRDDRLPGEAAVWQFFQELQDALSPEKHFELHPPSDGPQGDWCRVMWLDVAVRNQYGLPPSLPPGCTVVDVGCNVGAYAYACLERGAASVRAFEPLAANCDMARRNLARFGRGLDLSRLAVWRSDVPQDGRSLPLLASTGPGVTGGYSVVRPGEPVGEASPWVSLDSVLGQLDRVARLKLDCEGAEFPILYTSRLLDRVDAIDLEVHEGCDATLAGPEPEGGWPPWTWDGMVRFLESRGFAVEFRLLSEAEAILTARRVK